MLPTLVLHPCATSKDTFLTEKYPTFPGLKQTMSPSGVATGNFGLTS